MIYATTDQTGHIESVERGDALPAGAVEITAEEALQMSEAGGHTLFKIVAGKPVLDSAAVDAAMLDTAKAERIEQINSHAAAQIVSGFPSSATGTIYTYDSEQTDQLNLIGAVASGLDMPWPCTDANGVKALVPHTAAQLAQVLQDGAAVKQQILADARAARDAVNAATTVAEVDAVVYP